MGRTSHASCPKAAPGSKAQGHRATACMGTAPGPGWWVLRFDGGVHGNGRATAVGRWAYRATGPGGRVIAAASGVAGGDPVTVNTAEWGGLLAGLSWASDLGPGTAPGLLIEGDSDLVISQLTGRWQTRGQLIGFRDGCLDALAALFAPWHARWIPRERNADCDRMCSMKGRA